MKIYLDTDELYQAELYEHKLATILGRGKRLKRMLRAFPTEYEFKQASIPEISQALKIKNPNSKILSQLKKLDQTYQRLMTPKFGTALSNAPEAETIMCIDTEYLWSDLDSIQYAIKSNQEWKLGILFTNSDLAPAISASKGIKILEDIINEVKPDIFVGHNFNCDITVLEKVYGTKIDCLHNYDDTMKMVRKSHVSNIIGGASLDRIIEKIFSDDTVGLINAYQDLDDFIKYGLKDAIYPIYAREYFMTGKLPLIDSKLKIDKVVQSEVRDLIDFQFIYLGRKD
ncbi:hypothetical protein MWH28_06560 [Natroniella sulfidigena]|uniref:hypothetical protein n=1 Tax=Natroniella sulfidigena TaxID=723921 RepID=UPI00200B915A|nr:hypothetical protein [Natroniella sulfidigena]MCK8817033.1 hypothetical protein [Natroniella sulfidigena]